jgi:hypothetical protein
MSSFAYKARLSALIITSVYITCRYKVPLVSPWSVRILVPQSICIFLGDLGRLWNIFLDAFGFVDPMHYDAMLFNACSLAFLNIFGSIEGWVLPSNIVSIDRSSMVNDEHD